MASVQDIETRIIGLENMLKFVLTLFSVQEPNNPFARPIPLLEAYYRYQAAGGAAAIAAARVVEGEVIAPPNQVQE